MTIIGITGYAQHGKDSLAGALVEKGLQRMAFADALKSMALVLNPWILKVWNFDGPQRLQDVVDYHGWETAKSIDEVRRFLQVLGTEGVRDHVGPESWVEALEKQWMANKCPSICISDVRFPNEAAWVKRNGGTMVRVVRTDFDNGLGLEHPSEMYIAELPVDHEVRLPSGALEMFPYVARYLIDGKPSVYTQRGPKVPTRAELEDLFN